MWLSEFTVNHCRIIDNASLSFHPNLNYIYGDNASGKTSFLEALSVLSIGRSFRTSRISDVISYDNDYIRCTATLESSHSSQKNIGVEKSKNKTTIRINRKTIKSQAELSRMFPLSIIHPGSHELITGSANKRRRFVDWIAFYQYQGFHTLWKKYQSILRQRNAALKSPHLFYALEHLTYELAQLQQPIHQLRSNALNELSETIHQYIPKNLLKCNPVLSLGSGFPSKVNLDTDSILRYYNNKIADDKKRGRTLKGVHSCDLSILLNNKPAASSASRGQIKILSLLLHIAQSITLSKSGIIAIDDLAAEVDKKNYQMLCSYITGIDQQVFITSTHTPDPAGISQSASMFHVEHGKFKK